MRFLCSIVQTLGGFLSLAGLAAPGGASVEPLPLPRPSTPIATSPSQEFRIEPSTNGVSLTWQSDPASFGSSLAIGRLGDSSQPTLMVGARNWNPGHGVVGGVFFTRFDSQRRPVQLPLHLSGRVLEAQFGSQIATVPAADRNDPDNLVVFSVKTGPDWPYGAAWWLFQGTSSGISPEPSWGVGHGRSANRFGRPVSSAGDINGDSIPDMLIGVARSNETRPYQGFFAAFHGSTNGFTTQPDWIFAGTTRGMRLGLAVTGVGDINRDGFDDVVAGAPSFPGDLTARGQALLFLGSASGLQTTPAWTATVPEHRAWFGAEIVGAGDLNGDGFNDVLIAAPGPILADQRRPDWTGTVYVFAGSSAGLSTEPVARIPGRKPGEYFGRVVCRIGDMDGDGRIEIAVGAPTATATQDLQGAVYLFSISRDFSVEARGHLPGRTAREALGWSLIAGDLDQDGHPDLAIGAPFREPTANHVGFGGVEIVWGGSNALPPEPTSIDPQPASTSAAAPPAPSFWPLWIAGTILGLGGVLGTLWAWRSRRQFVQMRASILTDERGRIARDLHDEVGSMAGNLAQIARLTRNQSDRSHPALADNLDSLVNTTEQLSESLAEVVWLTAPTHDNLEDFACRLADHAVETANANGFRCRLDLPDTALPLVIGNELRRDLYLAAKEAIHNAVRHSAGTTLSIHLSVDPTRLSITIQDDGKGLVPNPPDSRVGHGLQNMRDRLQRHHGSCQSESLNPGARIVLTVPLDNPPTCPRP